MINFSLHKLVSTLSICYLACFHCGGVSAQQVRPLDTFGVDSAALAITESIDTYYLVILTRDLKRPDRIDTAWIKTDFHFLPAESRPLEEQFHLGNAGSAARPILYGARKELGFDAGLHGYDIYKFNSDNLRFYRSTETRALLSYNQGGQQEQNQTYAELGREFNGPTGLSLRYMRVNDVGFYTHQRNLNTAFEVGAYFFPKEIPFKTFISFNSHTFNAQDNGGVTTDTLFNDEFFDDRQAIPVWSETAETQDKGWEVRATNYYTTRISDKLTARLKQDVSYTFRQYKFFDVDPDPDYYGAFTPPEPGWRQFMKWKTLRHEIGADVGLKGARFPANLYAGLDYRRTWVTHEPEEFVINNLFLHGIYSQKLGKIGDLNAELRFDILDQAGTYDLDAGLAINVGSFANATVGIRSGNYEPSRIDLRFQRFAEEFWSNDFNRTQVNTLYGRIKFNKLPLIVLARNQVVQNAIFYDEQRLPQQLGQTANIAQAAALFHFRLGALQTEHEFLGQWSSSDELRIPSFAGRHYVGSKLRLFKRVLTLNTGLEIRYLSTYEGLGYFPLTGQFHQANEDVVYKFRLDGVVGFDVKTFHFFLRLDNISFLWDNEIRYLIEGYPLSDFRIRFGIRWEILD